MSNSTDNSTTGGSVEAFNPLLQNVTFFAANGITPITVSMTDIDTWRESMYSSIINCSIQAGAALLMFVVYIILSPPKKRATPIFLLNSASLLISAIANILLLSYYPSMWTEFYTWFSADNTFIPQSAINTDVAADLIGPFYVAVIEASLLMQTNVICNGLINKYRMVTIIAGYLVAITAISFNFCQTVLIVLATLHPAEYANKNFSWADKGTNISWTFSLWFFCLIFTHKLVTSMWNRRSLGVKKMGPMRIIAIMGGCTMVIPCKLYYLHLLFYSPFNRH